MQKLTGSGMNNPRSAKCQACEGIFLKAELSEDGRCPKCVATGRKPKREYRLD